MTKSNHTMFFCILPYPNKKRGRSPVMAIAPAVTRCPRLARQTLQILEGEGQGREGMVVADATSDFQADPFEVPQLKSGFPLLFFTPPLQRILVHCYLDQEIRRGVGICARTLGSVAEVRDGGDVAAPDDFFAQFPLERSQGEVGDL